MPIASRFRHDVVIHRHTAGEEEDVDARGNRTDEWEPQDPIKGNVQRRSRREIRGTDPAGVAVAEAIAFLPIGTSIDEDDLLQAEGSLYEVIGPARDAGGRGRHLEVDLAVAVP